MSRLDKIRQKQGRPATAAAPVGAAPPSAQPKPGSAKPEAPKVTPKPKRDPDAGRLPDGAEFTAKYDAKAKRWTGKLTIGDAVFDSSASGVFRLMINLDAAYRASLGATAQPVSE
jgi:hypothetical protein